MKRLALWLYVALACLALPPSASADFTLFDDPAMASHPNLLQFTTASTTQTSITFAPGQGQSRGLISVRLTGCSSCNVTFQMWATGGSSVTNADYMICTDSTALTATGTYNYTLGAGTDATNAGAGSPFGIKLNCNRTMPPLFYVILVFNSGTNMTGTVKGYSW